MTFTSSFGLPCVHTLKKLEEAGGALLLEHFHPHWHLKRDMSRPHPILEPRKAPSLLNQRRKQPATSTRREPSAFETIEAATRPKALPKCSMCHTIGHTMTSKSCPLRYTELFQPPASVTEITAHTTSIVVSDAVATTAAEATTAHATIGQKDEHLMVAMQAPTGYVRDDQALEVQALADRESGSHTSTVETVADCIIVNSTVVQQAAVAESSVVGKSTAPKLRYNDPQAIYQRYVESRQAWYDAQPRGSVKTNQQYRKAMGLPQRYNRAELAWCLDWKQMDWDKAEEDRVEAKVAAEMEANPFSDRRGMGDIWEAAAADCVAQEALYLGE
ncbi:transposase-like protein [Beauveria bassiana ARSEF 2860]|uniref:Transposase-like protein n=1 Tax=Beauveria bassiana (strain ARSEF 2860) TaxID=655819 RepID=J4W3S4_BEAB2|nr:transposase-like protein [Beauveria bassiana ARSEF 2860]EJP65070.1 transposase-like protein [Beauveria bassiana ARSEF 2860]